LAAIEAQADLEPVGIIEPLRDTAEAGERSADNLSAYPLHTDPGALFASTRPDVVVDFSNAAFSATLVEAALEHGVRPVIGTSSVPDAVVARLRAGLAERRLGGVLAPNFALGAVVLMHLARIAAPYFDAAEVIELHHDGKVDSPSGTAVATAQLIREARGAELSHRDSDIEHVPGARGAQLGGVGLHSVRLPGLVAHQEVIFGGQGQTLTLRHDSTGRDSFMPGVLLAVREVMRREELVTGLDSLIGLG
ncbi:MAG: 4-hydroxy-tetrahydrodipicolinate reductase, partial [Chloroflexi bacterium]|nr:4-hydroxy-tetrahydrodipicolinate reductase [Chloroflexota bacterium]